jgi:hypothetical protein
MHKTYHQRSKEIKPLITRRNTIKELYLNPVNPEIISERKSSITES